MKGLKGPWPFLVSFLIVLLVVGTFISSVSYSDMVSPEKITDSEIKVKFRIESSITHQRLYIAVENYQDKEDILEFDALIKDANFDTNNIKNKKLYKETNISYVQYHHNETYTNCTPVNSSTNSSGESKCTYTSNPYFTSKTKLEWIEVTGKNIVTDKRKSLLEPEILKFKLEFDTPITNTGSGWGSAGTVYLNVSSKNLDASREFVDKTNSSWWESLWLNCRNITIEEINGTSRISEPIEYNITGLNLTNAVNEIRIVDDSCTGSGAEITSQVLDSDDSTYARVVFLANATINANTTYSIYYNNNETSAPTYSTDLNIIGTNVWNTHINVSVHDDGGNLDYFYHLSGGNVNIKDDRMADIYTADGAEFDNSVSDATCTLLENGSIMKHISCLEAGEGWVQQYWFYAESERIVINVTKGEGTYRILNYMAGLAPFSDCAWTYGELSCVSDPVEYFDGIMEQGWLFERSTHANRLDAWYIIWDETAAGATGYRLASDSQIQVGKSHQGQNISVSEFQYWIGINDYPDDYTKVVDEWKRLKNPLKITIGDEETEAIGDTTPPVIEIQLPINQTYNTSSVMFNVTLDEETDWCGYSLDGASNVSMDADNTTSFSKRVTLSHGGHNVKFSCNDTTGNMNNTVSPIYFSASITLTIVREWQYNYSLIFALTSNGVLILNKTDTPGACIPISEGAFYYDASLQEFQFCDGSSWQQVSDNSTLINMINTLTLNASKIVSGTFDGTYTMTGNLNVSEHNVTAKNVFLPQYIFSHTNATIPVLDADLWTNITFDQEDADIKDGISHNALDATNNTFTIMEDGIYNVDYDLDVEDTSASASDIGIAGRLILVNGTEVVGSVFEIDLTKQGAEAELSHNFLVSCLAGEQFIFQFVASDADVQISTHATYGDHPESATVLMMKIANLP